MQVVTEHFVYVVEHIRAKLIRNAYRFFVGEEFEQFKQA